MSTIADKLQDLIEAKADMKAALQLKGVTPTGGLSTYADAISQINSGSSTSGSIRFNKTSLREISIDGDSAMGIGSLFSELFIGCTNLIKITTEISKNVTSLYQTFKNCNSLTYLDATFDTSNVWTMYQTFYNCYLLEELPELDCSKITKASDITGTFYGCNSLRNLGGLKNLRCSVDLGYSPLTAKSAYDISNSLYNLEALTGTTITLSGDTYLNMLNDNLYDVDTVVSIATRKGWTVNFRG